MYPWAIASQTIAEVKLLVEERMSNGVLESAPCQYRSATTCPFRTTISDRRLGESARKSRSGRRPSMLMTINRPGVGCPAWGVPAGRVDCPMDVWATHINRKTIIQTVRGCFMTGVLPGRLAGDQRGMGQG